MIENILFYCHSILLLVFGTVLSFLFSGLRPSKKTSLIGLCSMLVCGALQLLVFFFIGEEMTWKTYPLTTHLPLALILFFFGKKHVSTIIASISFAYMFCLPAKWFGMLFSSFSDSAVLDYSVRICALICSGFMCIRFFSSYISELFNKDSRSVLIFSSVPIVYYVFDYIMVIYTNLWENSNRLAVEFLPLFLCLSYIAFCVVYYKEYEKKSAAERKEQMIRITVEQQEKEIETIKKSITETRLLRHDMRHMLSNLALSIEQNDKEHSLKMISGFASKVEATAYRRYCEDDTVNYILSSFEHKCKDASVRFEAAVELDYLPVDSVMFSSIISNALDNALNAQEHISEENRFIKIMLKESENKLLLSVKNPYGIPPVFSDGLPVSNKKGHGYGTQSIRYMTEKLGGNCQFSIRDNLFVLRVAI